MLAFYLVYLIFYLILAQEILDNQNRFGYREKSTSHENGDFSHDSVENQEWKNKIEPTIFEVKAVFRKCSKSEQNYRTGTYECNSNDTKSSHHRTTGHRNRLDNKADESIMQNCEKMISLTLRIKNKGITTCKPQYIVIDHIFDPTTDKKQKLLNPYVLKIKQKSVMQSYELLFENVVNAGPVERVLKQNSDGFNGCNGDTLGSACKTFKYNDPEVPYSNGFCCSCNKKEPDTLLSNTNSLENVFPSPSESSIEQFPSGDITQKITIDYDNPGPFTNQSSWNSSSGFDFNDMSAERWIRSESEKGLPNLVHYNRGHQNCRDTLAQADSAHCMEFSDLWYSVYHITSPELEYTIAIQIYEKISVKNGRIAWKDITYGKSILLGTSRQKFVSKDSNVFAYYQPEQEIEHEFSLNPKTQLLLIPETKGKERDFGQYQEVRGGAEEYLIIKENDLDLSGKTCNKAGVGYEAFARQPRRCDVEQNSCLQNQPKDMWQHDYDLYNNGKKGQYFLKNFGVLPEHPIRNKHRKGGIKNQKNKMLFMYYTSWYTSVVNIIFADDWNVVLRSDVHAIITEVYIETLNPKKTTITAKVFNSGLVTSIYQVGLDACPMELPASFGSITSEPAKIAPQHQHMFVLEIYCELPLKHFHCSLEVLNLKNQLIAVRRIRFNLKDRCICSWYCQCTCWETDSELKCIPLEIEQFHSAGYQGGMPVPSQVIDRSAFDNTLSIILHILLLFCLTLWCMGFMKAFLGCCILPIGLWGLDIILDLPKKLNRYYEPKLQDENVVYDEEGWPIHPQTGKKVHNVAPATQFAINMIFFFVFPIEIIVGTVRKLVAPKHSTIRMYDDLDVCKCKASRMSLVNDHGLQNSANRKSEMGKKSSSTNVRRKSSQII